MTLGVYMAKNLSGMNGRISVTVRISALHADVTQKKCSGWKPNPLTSVFSLRTSIFTSPHGTMLTALADVKYICLRMLDRLVSTHPKKCFILQPWKRMKLAPISNQKENVPWYTLEGKCFVENVLGVGCFIHRHLKNIDCLSHLVCFISTVNGRSNNKKKRKEEAYHWKAGTSIRHITDLKQSILETFDINGFIRQGNVCQYKRWAKTSSGQTNFLHQFL